MICIGKTKCTSRKGLLHDLSCDGAALSKDSLFDEISLRLLLIARGMFFMMEGG